jgi:superfamily II DNA/RNA helicase
MDGFRAGSSKVMVATDIAARGIDVLSISHVVNYDMPDCADNYTHRIGRTGRIENKGEAFTFVTPEDSLMVRDLEKLLGYKIERRTIEGFDYNTAAPPRPALRPMGQPGRRSLNHSYGGPRRPAASRK